VPEATNGFVNFEGIPFWFKKRWLIVPALTLKKIREYDTKWRALGAIPDATATDEAGKQALQDWMDKRSVIIEETVRAALRRNYNSDELTDDDIAEFLNYDNMQKALEAAQGTAKQTLARYRSPGEVKPAEASPSPWTGVTSTGASQPGLP
jgi:hypothetical protein